MKLATKLLAGVALFTAPVFVNAQTKPAKPDAARDSRTISYDLMKQENSLKLDVSPEKSGNIDLSKDPRVSSEFFKKSNSDLELDSVKFNGTAYKMYYSAHGLIEKNASTNYIEERRLMGKKMNMKKDTVISKELTAIDLYADHKRIYLEQLTMRTANAVPDKIAYSKQFFEIDNRNNQLKPSKDKELPFGGNFEGIMLTKATGMASDQIMDAYVQRSGTIGENGSGGRKIMNTINKFAITQFEINEKAVKEFAKEAHEKTKALGSAATSSAPKNKLVN